MEVSGATSTTASAVQVDSMKKSMDVQEQQVLKVLDSSNEQPKEMTAQKTGMGNNLNLTA
ncbi:MAG: hypothetical protein U9P72_06615 [Campylobacterota bacterium]|nr:hypothetical protein [Campylobacterota bacterium]